MDGTPEHVGIAITLLAGDTALIAVSTTATFTAVDDTVSAAIAAG